MTGIIPQGWEGNWEYVAMAWGISLVVLIAYAVSLHRRSEEKTS